MSVVSSKKKKALASVHDPSDANGANKRSRSSENYTSELACKALDIVLQYFLIPKLGICIDGLEDRLEILKDSISQQNLSTLPNDANDSDDDESDEDDQIQENQYLTNRNLIQNWRAIKVDFERSRRHLDHLQRADRHDVGQLKQFYLTNWVPISKWIEYCSINGILDLQDAYINLHQTVFKFFKTQEERWSTQKTGRSMSSLIVHQISTYLKWQNVNRTIEMCLSFLSLIPHMLHKERKLEFPDHEWFSFDKLRLHVDTIYNVIVHHPLQPCYDGIIDTLHQISSQIHIVIDRFSVYEQSKGCSNRYSEHNRCLSLVQYNMNRYLKNLHETWLQRCNSLGTKFCRFLDNDISFWHKVIDDTYSTIFEKAFKSYAGKRKPKQYQMLLQVREAIVMNNLLLFWDKLFFDVDYDYKSQIPINSAERVPSNIYSLFRWVTCLSPFETLRSIYSAIAHLSNGLVNGIEEDINVDKVLFQFQRGLKHGWELVVKAYQLQLRPPVSKGFECVLCTKMSLTSGLARILRDYEELIFESEEFDIEQINRCDKYLNQLEHGFALSKAMIDAWEREPNKADRLDKHRLTYTADRDLFPMSICNYDSSYNISIETLQYELMCIYRLILPEEPHAHSPLALTEHCNFVLEAVELAVASTNYGISMLYDKDMHTTWNIKSHDLNDTIFMQELTAWTFMSLLNKVTRVLEVSIDDKYCEQSFHTMLKKRKSSLKHLQSASLCWVECLKHNCDDSSRWRHLSKAVLIHEMLNIYGVVHMVHNPQNILFLDYTAQLHETFMKTIFGFISCIKDSLLPVLLGSRNLIGVSSDVTNVNDCAVLQYYIEYAYWISSACQLMWVSYQLERWLKNWQRDEDNLYEDRDYYDYGVEGDEEEADDERDDNSNLAIFNIDQIKKSVNDERAQDPPDDEESDNAKRLMSIYESCMASCMFIWNQVERFQEAGIPLISNYSNLDAVEVMKLLNQPLTDGRQREVYFQAHSIDKNSVSQAFQQLGRSTDEIFHSL